MPEAKPSSTPGPYGRRNAQISNTAEEGELSIQVTLLVDSLHTHYGLIVIKLV